MSMSSFLGVDPAARLADLMAIAQAITRVRRVDHDPDYAGTPAGQNPGGRYRPLFTVPANATAPGALWLVGAPAVLANPQPVDPLAQGRVPTYLGTRPAALTFTYQRGTMPRGSKRGLAGQVQLVVDLDASEFDCWAGVMAGTHPSILAALRTEYGVKDEAMFSELVQAVTAHPVKRTYIVRHRQAPTRADSPSESLPERLATALSAEPAPQDAALHAAVQALLVLARR